MKSVILFEENAIRIFTEHSEQSFAKNSEKLPVRQFFKTLPDVRTRVLIDENHWNLRYVESDYHLNEMPFEAIITPYTNLAEVISQCKAEGDDLSWLLPSSPVIMPSESNVDTQFIQEDIERLQAENENLKAEILTLQQELAAMQTAENEQENTQQAENLVSEKIVEIRTVPMPTMETLLTFLPCFYARFWTQITPSDLALLVGSYDVPEIKSPFPEPDTATIQAKLKQFALLPETEQEKLLAFCRTELKHHSSLKARLECVELLEMKNA